MFCENEVGAGSRNEEAKSGDEFGFFEVVDKMRGLGDVSDVFVGFQTDTNHHLS